MRHADLRRALTRNSRSVRRSRAPGLLWCAASLLTLAANYAAADERDEPVELYGAAADEQGVATAPPGPAPVAPTAPAAPNAPSGAEALGLDSPPGLDSGRPGSTPPPPPGVDPFVPTASTHPPAGSALAAGDPPARIGRLGLFEGRVSVRAGAPDDDATGVWLEATRNRPVVAGDSVWADQNSRAELHVGSLEVRLSSETLLQVLLLDDAHVRLALLQGSLDVVRHAERARAGAVEICPPGMVVELRTAGSYRLDVSSEGQLKGLTARNGGQALARSEGQDVTVASGQQLRPSAGEANDGGPLRVRQANAQPDAFDTWSQQRARAQRNAKSLRYVSRNMVGYEDLDDYGDWTSSPVYGPLWGPRQVGADWAPFRSGHWANVSPWGWTWVDDAPWGFAPFHYGRWVYVDARWYWAPGSYAAYPTYAPHLVAFAGGGMGFGVGVGAGSYWGSNVGWYPLGFYDPFYPAYPCSYGYAHGLNGPRPLPHFGPGGPNGAYGYGGWRGGPRGVGGPRVPGSVTVAPRGTVMGGLPVGPVHRPLPPNVLGHIGRAGWGSRMPVGPGGAAFPSQVAGAVARPPGFDGARGPGVAAPPATAWSRGWGAGRGPQVVGPNGARLEPRGPFAPRVGTAVGGPAVRPGSMPSGRVQPLQPGYVPMPGRAPTPGYHALPAYRYEPHYEQHGFGGGAPFGGPRPGSVHGGSMGTFRPGPGFGGPGHGPHR